MPAQELIAIGSVTAALIAGAFSYLNLVISKEQKVSEFRQQWIDALRESISQYVSAISCLAKASATVNENVVKENGPDHVKETESCFELASKSYASILLRINPDDTRSELKELNADFLAKLESVRAAVRKDRYEEARQLTDELELKARRILKLEWERVKEGEPIYQVSLYIAAFITLIAVVGIGLFAFMHMYK